MGALTLACNVSSSRHRAWGIGGSFPTVQNYTETDAHTYIYLEKLLSAQHLELTIQGTLLSEIPVSRIYDHSPCSRHGQTKLLYMAQRPKEPCRDRTDYQSEELQSLRIGSFHASCNFA
jgi:hypothetical protein